MTRNKTRNVGNKVFFQQAWLLFLFTCTNSLVLGKSLNSDLTASAGSASLTEVKVVGSNDSVVNLQSAEASSRQDNASNSLSQTFDFGVGNSDNTNNESGDKLIEKRVIGVARHWLKTNDDASHFRNGSYVGIRYDHADHVPWGSRSRDETKLLLPPFLQKPPNVINMIKDVLAPIGSN